MTESENSRSSELAQTNEAAAKAIYTFIRQQLRGVERRKAEVDAGRFTGILSRRKRKHKLETLLELTGKDTQFQALIGNAMEKGSRIPGRNVNELLLHGYMIGNPPFSVHKIASDFRVNPILIRRIFINQGSCIQLGRKGWVVFDDINEMVNFSKEKTESKSDRNKTEPNK